MRRPRVLTIHGGSSSIRFAVYELGDTLERRLEGKIDRIGLSGTSLTCDDPARPPPNKRALAGSKSATTALMDWLEVRKCLESVRAVGHRMVQGMQHTAPELVTPELLDDLRRISPADPDHLPREIEMIEPFRQRHPELPQVACFDTAFHRTMPRIARLFPYRGATERRAWSATVSTVCPMPISWKSSHALATRRQRRAA